MASISLGPILVDAAAVAPDDQVATGVREEKEEEEEEDADEEDEDDADEPLLLRALLLCHLESVGTPADEGETTCEPDTLSRTLLLIIALTAP